MRLSCPQKGAAKPTKRPRKRIARFRDFLEKDQFCHYLVSLLLSGVLEQVLGLTNGSCASSLGRGIRTTPSSVTLTASVLVKISNDLLGPEMWSSCWKAIVCVPDE